jgi:hypothetical protein
MIKRLMPGALAAIVAPAIAASTTTGVPSCPANYPLNGVALTKVPAGWVESPRLSWRPVYVSQAGMA